MRRAGVRATAGLGAGVVMLFAGAATAQRAPEAVEATPAITIRSEGLAAALPSDKDAALRELATLAPGALRDLPTDLGLPVDVGPSLEMLASLFTYPFELKADRSDAGANRVRLELEPGGRGEPRVLLEEMVRRFTGLEAKELPQGGVRFGPAGPEQITVTMSGGRPGSPAVLTVGEGAWGPAWRGDLPGDVELVFVAHVDGRRFFRRELEQGHAETFLFGLAALQFDMALGYENEHARMALRIEGVEDLGPLFGPGQVLTEADLQVAPRDAQFVKVAQFDAAAALQWAEWTTGERFTLLDELSESMGVDVRREILDRMGVVFTTYRSRSVGGGGLLSTIIVGSLRDAPGFERAIERAAGPVDQGLAAMAGERVRVRRWEQDGRAMYALVTPGLPIPVELTMTVEGDRLVLGATPWTVAAAAAHIRDGDPSILDAPVIGARLREADDLTGVLFVNTPETATAAYGVATGLMAAARNVVTSVEAGRRPMQSPPDWLTFTAGVQPIIALARRDGNVMTVTASGDRSMLVNGSALAHAAISDFQTLLAPVPATLLPALSHARENAKQLKAASQVRGFVQASIAWHSNEARMATIEELLENWFIDEQMLRSPYGPASDLGPDFALYSGEVWADEFSASLPVAIDRAAYLNGATRVPVGFADSHVESLTPEEVRDLLERHPKVAAAFRLEREGDAGGVPTVREAMTEVRTVMMAFMIYAAEHDDRLPTTADDVRPYLGEQGVGAASWRWGAGSTGAIEQPQRMVMGVVAAEGRYVLVFADGHAEAMDEAAYRALMAEPQNADFDPAAR